MRLFLYPAVLSAPAAERTFIMNYYNIDEAAKRIQNARKKSGYTQEQAAEVLNVDRTSIGRIERGAMACSVDMFIKFAELYDVTLDYLIVGKESERNQFEAELDTVIAQLTEMKRNL